MNPEEKVIHLDVDGVLGDFNGSILDAVEEFTGYRIADREIAVYQTERSPIFEKVALDCGMDYDELRARIRARCNEIGFCSAIKPFAQAQEAVAELRTMGWSVEALTAPLGSNPTWIPERFAWLKRHFAIDRNEVHPVSKKARIVGDIFVDDKSSNVADWARAMERFNPTRRALLWDAPYNRDARFPDEWRVVRATSWRDVIAVAKDFP